MKIILTGATGLIGSRFVKLMHENHELYPLSSRDADITADTTIATYLDFPHRKEADVMIHFAAKTNVDQCEEDKVHDQKLIANEWDGNGQIKNAVFTSTDWIGKYTAFNLNYIGTRNLYWHAKDRGMKFVYVSTDFVFDGNGEYSEDSKENPLNWYGMTKWYGENVVDTAMDLIVRISFPYGYPSVIKNDFFWGIANLLRAKDEVSLITDQTITPTFIDDVVNGIDFLLQKNATGIYHLSGSSAVNPYEVGQTINSMFGYKTKINPTTREQVYVGKAPRPFQSVMKNDKLTSLGFRPKTFDEGLELLKNT